jgi:hypothetical protein
VSREDDKPEHRAATIPARGKSITNLTDVIQRLKKERPRHIGKSNNWTKL